MKATLLFLLLAAGFSRAAAADSTREVKALQESLGHVEDRLSRQVNEMFWFQRLGEIAEVDRVRFTGPPPRGTNGIAPAPGSNDVIVSALTFMPKRHSWLGSRQRPLIVFAHGEIHGNTATDEDVHVVEELVRQGYAVIATDYRGSSGYGPEFWRKIDYGGLEIEDVHAARRVMLDLHPNLDPKRVGVIGWSHGGLIALLTAFAHPDDYQVCYAGVPVGDLIERIRIRGKDYEQLFAAPYHIGKTVADAPAEYQRRSPAWNARQLRIPLLIQANTSDDDVTIQEVNHLIRALKSADRDFTSHIYTNAPGGHLFNRLDTAASRQSRGEIWRFLDRHLHPPYPQALAR